MIAPSTQPGFTIDEHAKECVKSTKCWWREVDWHKTEASGAAVQSSIWRQGLPPRAIRNAVSKSRQEFERRESAAKTSGAANGSGNHAPRMTNCRKTTLAAMIA